MNVATKLLAVGALLAASSPFAFATPITNNTIFTGTGDWVTGTGPYTANGNTYQSTDTGFNIVTLATTPASTGTIPAGKTMSITGHPFVFSRIGTATPPGAELFSVGSGGLLYAFYVTSDAPLPSTGGNDLILHGILQISQGGVVKSSQYDVFELITTNTPAGAGAYNFTALLAQAPEPSGLVLLGTGMLVAFGAARRRLLS